MRRMLCFCRHGMSSFVRWCLLLIFIALSLQYGLNVRVFVSYRSSHEEERVQQLANWSEIALPGAAAASEEPFHTRHPVLWSLWSMVLRLWWSVFGLPPCPSHPALNAGPIKIEEGWFPMSWMENQFGDVQTGGRWRPSHCQPHHKVAVVVPFRNRDIQLRTFLHHMNPFLQRQYLDYTLFLIEQTQENEFNRGLLLNAGFVEALALDDYDCFIFHDVDMLPEDDRIPYACNNEMVVHLSVALSRTNYSIPYDTFLGGVLAATRGQYEAANGYSNGYFGWGAEDDDFGLRLKANDINVTRDFDSGRMRFKTVKHKKQKVNRKKDRYLRHWKSRWRYDGLSSLSYRVMEQEERPLFSWYLVDINYTDVMENVDSYMPSWFRKRYGGHHRHKNPYHRFDDDDDGYDDYEYLDELRSRDSPMGKIRERWSAVNGQRVKVRDRG